MRKYIFNLETTKIELHFEKSEYTALTAEQKSDLKSAFLWSRTGGCWVSRAKEPNLWGAKQVAAKLGFTEEQREGERLSFSEQVERQADRAERRAERYEQYAENAAQRGASLQAPLNRMHGDIAFFTQPIIAGHAGSQAFARRREKMFAQYEKGFKEYRKSGYFQDRAKTAKATADGAKYRDIAYLDRRIKECKKEIRARKKNILHYEETLAAIENGAKKKRFDGTPISAEEVTGWMEREFELIEKAIDKQAFLEACVDQCGGIRFSKDNIKIGYRVKVKDDRYVEVIGAGPQNITYRILTGGAKGMVLQAAYAEIKEIIKAEEVREMHPFKVGEQFTAEQFVQDGTHRWKTVHVTYEIVKATTATIQLKPVDGSGKAITRKPKKSYSGRWCFCLDDNYHNTFYKDGEKVQRKQAKPDNADAQRITELVTKLNRYRHEYYNLAKPSVSDAVYDRHFDELATLERKTGIVLSNSPTQTVGYAPVSSLRKVRHPIPLLSMDKTKQVNDLVSMVAAAPALLMLKLDGLTVKLVYENGKLVEASTRGDGEVGEDITHNIPAFRNVPLKIPHKGRLVITGEGLIHTDDFEQMKDTEGKDIKNARNLAAGSIRLLDPAICKDRCIYFYAFNIIEGMNTLGGNTDSRGWLLEDLEPLGFEICPFIRLEKSTSSAEMENNIQHLRTVADIEKLPIDGIVLRYDSISYSRTLGRTGHHYKDGIAFKFEDDMTETVFRSIEWTPGRSGEIAPVALFDPVEIDGCTVSRASLHNLSFIKELELHPGCRILVSKRNMIIPHIEENLDRGHYAPSLIPKRCPCCGKATRIYARSGGKGGQVATLHCDNPDCGNQTLRKFVHFVGKKAMDISGLSEAILDKFISAGFLTTYQDLYHLSNYRNLIVRMDGFGIKSYEKLQEAINVSRKTTFARYLVAMDIPTIGRTASRALESYFGGSLDKFERAATGNFDFTMLPDFGATLNSNIHDWFQVPENLDLWRTLRVEFIFENKKEKITMDKKNPFNGCTIVATGKLEHFTRDGINSKIVSLGATAGSSVTRKTSYLICGEKPGSKLTKARELGIPVLTEQEFLSMIPA